MQYLQTLEYPAEAKEAGIEGQVFVQFVVNKQGRVANVTVVRSSENDLLDNTALHHIQNMPDWTQPGFHQGQPANLQFTVPIRFVLPTE